MRSPSATPARPACSGVWITSGLRLGKWTMDETFPFVVTKFTPSRNWTARSDPTEPLWRLGFTGNGAVVGTGSDPPGGRATGAVEVELGVTGGARLVEVGAGPGNVEVGVGGSVEVDVGGRSVVVVVEAGGAVVVVVEVTGGVVVVEVVDVVVGGGELVVVVEVVVVVVVVVVGSGKDAAICTSSKWNRPPCPGVATTTNRTAVTSEMNDLSVMLAVCGELSDSSSM